MDFPIADHQLPPHLQAPPALERMQELRGREKSDGDVASGVRIRAIRQEGLRVGAQTGLAERYSMIMEYLDSVENKINVTFSFAGFVRDGRLLIPAIIESQNNLSYDPETGTATEVRKAYTIEEEARVVTSVPTWRTYLYQTYKYPDPPHESLLPRTSDEVAEWKRAINEGWRAGVSQADMNFQDRKAELTRAVEGRHLYLTMEAKEMVSPAALRIQENKVTFNGRTMNVGEIIYSISSDAQYKTATGWEPIWSR